MNAAAVKTEILNVIAEAHTRMNARQIRKQYAPGKAQKATLTELGIIELMPAGYGFSDAAAVIAAAQSGRGTTTANAYGEGEDFGASNLYTLIHEVEQVATVQDPSMAIDKASELVEKHNGVYAEVGSQWYSVTDLFDGSEYPYYLAGGPTMMPASYERHYATVEGALNALLKFAPMDTWQDASEVSE